jgi:hypothetical protein
MRPIDRLTLAGLICAVVAIASFCLLLLIPFVGRSFSSTEVGEVVVRSIYWTLVIGAFGALVLGLAAMGRQG